MRHVIIRIGLISAFLAIWVFVVSSWRTEAKADESTSHDKIETAMNEMAERYVKLVLAVGEHDPIYVDAYSGPEAWRINAKEEKKPLATIEQEARRLIAELQKLDVSGCEDVVRLRRTFLSKQLESLAARTRMLQGVHYTFAEETKALYDIIVPPFNERDIKAKLARLDSLLPAGEGSLGDRLERLREDIIVPKDKVAAIFTTVIEEARRRTRQHIVLPGNESFSVEYVTNEPWVAYNWYKGNGHSVIQLNIDLPQDVDSLVHLACHEGYPGHHVQNVLFEQRLVKERGWVEFTVSPFFSPLSPLIEGSAEFGAEVVFPGEERLAFERDVLCRLAGLDAAKAATYDAVMTLVSQLGAAQNEAGRRYLNGELTAKETAVFLHTYTLMSLERARKRVAFMDRYRSYFVNLIVGYDLAKRYIEKKGGTPDQPGKRWDEYAALISMPRVPSEVK
jgi:hypothetical protein